jgi:hypothetical protein
MERKPQAPAKTPRPAAPSRPQGTSGRSGRGSASALEAWKKAEQSRVPRGGGRDPEIPSH